MNMKSGKVPRRRGRNTKDDQVVAGKHGRRNEHRPSNGNIGGSAGSSRNGSSTTIPQFYAPLIQWASDEASTWYEYGNHLPERNETIASSSTSSSTASLAKSMAKRTTPDMVRRYRSMADAIYQNEMRLYNHTKGQGKSPSSTAVASSTSSSSNTDDRWVENTMKKGTVKDRIAAMSVTLSSDPIHKLYALDGLLSMVGCSPDGNSSAGRGGGGGKPNSRVAQLTAEALDDLFVHTLLPADRKLVTLVQRPLYLFDDDNGKLTMSPRILLLWRFEELIKEKYDLYLRQYMARTLEDGADMQKKATLQSAATLLSSVPEGEAKLLGMMVNKLGDPDKKVAAAAGHQLRLVLEQHSNMQTIVAREVQQLAHRPHLSPKALYNCIIFLNQLHLKRASTEGEEESSSSLPASLVKTYFRLFEVAVKKPQKTTKNRSSEQEDTGSMKGRLLSALLTGVNRAHPYLPEKDQDMEEHVDALYRIVHTAPPAACTQALLLLFHLAVGSKLENEESRDSQQPDDSDKDAIDSESSSPQKQEDQRRERFYRALYATMSKANHLSNGKHLTMYFNVLYKAMKYDADQNRVLAFAKRLLAGTMHGPAPTTAASLYLLQEISKTHKSLQIAWGDVADPESNSWIVLDESKREPKAALVDKRMGGKVVLGQGNKRAEVLIPPMWEISALAQHFHPSVARFANDIGEIDFEGDPLTDFGLSSFLDKFAYKNPKSLENLMQQRPKTGAAFNRRTKELRGRLVMPLNDPAFLNQANVNEQEEFFHRFFVEQARRDEIKGIARHRKKEDSDDASDEENEAASDVAQERAFDAADEVEEFDTVVKSFEEYEAQWETDEEEEMFVDSLAMKMLETEAGGPADIDDDPYGVDNWGDLYKDDEDEAEKQDYEESESSVDDLASTDNDAKGAKADLEASADADFSASDDESASSDEEPQVDEKEIVIGLKSDCLTDDGEEELLTDLELLEDSEQSDDGTSDDDSTGGGKKKDLPLFASAEEYEELIKKSFEELKRRAPDSQEEENGITSTRGKMPLSTRKKRRKR